MKAKTEPRLTPRQRDFLLAVLSWTCEHGRPPSYRELALALGIRSPNAVHTQLFRIAAKGYLDGFLPQRGGNEGRCHCAVRVAGCRFRHRPGGGLYYDLKDSRAGWRLAEAIWDAPGVLLAASAAQPEPGGRRDDPA
jgi:hypothetical protein